MTAATFAEWLAAIVADDDPANGGPGTLTIGNCPECDGYGIIECASTWYAPGPRLESCPSCEGTGNAAPNDAT